MTTRLYMRTLHAGNAPTSGEKSTALPVDTLGANNATGLDQQNLQLFIKRQVPTSDAVITKASDATTSARDNFLGRWTSRPLGAQTFGSGTWTIAMGFGETSTNANSFLVMSVYVWNPGGSSVRGFIYDSHTSLGTEWVDSPTTGRVVTFTGSNVTASAGDVLVVEVWRHAAQSMGVAYNQTIDYDGTTDVTAGVTSDMASYLETPSATTLAFQNDDASHPQLRGTAHENGTTTITVDKPTGTVDGDVLVAFVTCRGDSSVTDPGGWTLVREDHNGTGSTDRRLYVFTKVASSEPSTWSFTQGGSTSFNVYATVSTFYNVDTTTPVDATSSNSGSSTGPSSSAVSSTRANGRLLVGMAIEANRYTAIPSAIDEMTTTDFGDPSVVDTNVWDKFLTTAGAAGTFSWTVNTSQAWVVTAVIIQPVATATPSLLVPHRRRGLIIR